MAGEIYNQCGVLYVLFGGHKPRELELRQSIASLRKHSPAMPIAVISDKPRKGVDLNIPLAASSIRGDHWQTRIAAFSQTPFTRTLYLDTDTIVCSDVRPLFDLLDTYEFCAAPCTTQPEQRPGLMMFNCGVMLWRFSTRTLSLMAEWEHAYINRPATDRADQESFSRVIPPHVAFGALHPRWNLRLNVAHTLITAAGIVHCKDPEAAEVATKLNADPTLRRHYIPGRREVIAKKKVPKETKPQ